MVAPTFWLHTKVAGRDEAQQTVVRDEAQQTVVKDEAQQTVVRNEAQQTVDQCCVCEN